ncbi:MAG: InlB B-repeat-containing protein, partial [Clostridia bacterium]|nr:InlB B-repeat-containing protein [Clostridia bacterium]
MVRAFGARTKADISAFTDVPANAWYYDYISKAVKMEALYGKSETSMAPEQNITREEVFTVLARILVLESDNSAVLSKFKDKADVSDWAVKSISALVEKGYVNGDDLGNLNPKANITREEFAQVMHNMIKVYITKPGIYTDDLNGITVLRVGGVTLKNMKNVSDLVAGDGVGFDEVKLEDVEIEGRLLTRGGEFTLKRTTVSENVVVKNVNGVVHFNNYRTEDVFSDINEITTATFLKRTTGGSGGSPTVPSAQYTVKHIREGLDGSYDETVTELYEEENLSGAIGQLTQASAKTYEGFTALPFSQETVAASGTTVTIKYERNKHDVTFKLDNGEADYVVQDVKFGTLLNTIVPTPTKAGWAFAGWNPVIDGTTTLGDAPVTYTAQWSQTHAQYTVKHVLEELDGTYDEAAAEIEYNNGEIGQPTQAVAKTYEGFTVIPFSQETITLSGATVIIKYERNKHDVTFKLDNGEADYVVQNVKFGTLLNTIAPTPTKSGWSFIGWNPAIDGTTTLGDAPVTYTAQWSQTHAQYTVKHIREGLDGSYDETVAELYEDEALTGEIGQPTQAAVKTYEGFTALPFSQVDVLSDGTAVVTIKYERNKYDVTFKLDNGEADYVVQDVKFGTLLNTIVPTPTKAGWAFAGWNPAIDGTTTLGDAPATYTAQWSQTHAQYTVKHIREGLDGSYDETVAELYESESLNGVIGQPTQATAKTYEGFTALSFSQETVGLSGTVVTIKYERNKYDVTFKLDNGEADYVVQNVKFGTLLSTIAPTPAKSGWAFAGWNPAIDGTATLGDAPATYTAQWSQTHAQYTVKHIREGLDGSYDETVTGLYETESLNGEIGQPTQATVKTYEGFTALSFSQETVAATGTVVTIKYERNKYNVTFKLDNGEADIVRTNVKYGTPIVDIAPVWPSDFDKTDYNFAGWTPSVTAGTTLGDAPATYTAAWALKVGTLVVKHNYEAVEDSAAPEVVTSSSSVKIGDTTVSAETKTGFTADAATKNITVIENQTVTVEFFYTRNRYPVTFKLDNGEPDVVINNVKFGTSIQTLIPQNVEKRKYEFVAWNPAIDSNTTLGDASATYTATWKKVLSDYTVKHIRQAMDGSYEGLTAGGLSLGARTGENLVEEEILTGLIGAQTLARAKTYEGFTAVLDFEQAEIPETDDLVITIKYERNKHDVTFDLDNGQSAIHHTDVLYGTLISDIAPVNPAKHNYEFIAWFDVEGNANIDSNATLGDRDTTYKALWKKVYSDYTVKHVRENLDGTYDDTLLETEEKNGKIGEDTAAAAKDYEGFTALSFAQATIPETDDLVITIKYERNKYDVTFKLDNGEADVVRNDVKFGTLISDIVPTGFTKDDHEFKGWNPAIDDTTALGDAPATYTAVWEKVNATYVVKHIREGLDGTYDETVTDLYEDETLGGQVDELTQAVEKTYEGFTALSFTQATIEADDSTVVTIKYERNKYDVTFVLDNGEADVVIKDVKFGTAIEPLAPQNVEKVGHIFDRWDPEFDSTTVMPDEEVTYTALWTPERYKVRFGIGKYGNMNVTYETEVDYGTTVDKDIIDGQKTYTSSLYGYVKKADYAPFYNNEAHKTNSDYWYLNDDGEWEL